MPSPGENAWVEEVVHHGGDEYFADLARHLVRARSQIDFETYLFRTDELGSGLLELLEAAVVHHPAVLPVIIAAPRQRGERKRCRRPFRRRLERRDANRNDFLADAVTRDDGNLVRA